MRSKLSDQNAIKASVLLINENGSLVGECAATRITG